MPVDFDAVLNKPLLEVFGKVAWITPADGGDTYPVQVDRHADRAVEDNGGTVMQLEGTVHTMFARLSTFPAGRTLIQGDRVAINGAVFTVAGVPATDETGWLAINVFAGKVALDV